MDVTVEIGAIYIAIYLGFYSTTPSKLLDKFDLHCIWISVTYVTQTVLKVTLGHNRMYYNVKSIAMLQKMHKLKINHMITSIGRNAQVICSSNECDTIDVRVRC
ncbi:pyridoxine 5'-phosphate synthase [Candidatus Gillettellia adelgis]